MTVIPAMDHIDESLTNNSLDIEFEPSICAALGIAKKTLNKYYNATDQSEVYRIAMGTCMPSPYSFLITTCLSVLHPRHKLQYFERAGWQPDWIKTAEEIVRAKFEESYAAPADDSDDVDMLPPASTKKVHYLLVYSKSHRLILIYL
jgi:hypothetical protein